MKKLIARLKKSGFNVTAKKNKEKTSLFINLHDGKSMRIAVFCDSGTIGACSKLGIYRTKKKFAKTGFYKTNKMSATQMVSAVTRYDKRG